MKRRRHGALLSLVVPLVGLGVFGAHGKHHATMAPRPKPALGRDAGTDSGTGALPGPPGPPKDAGSGKTALVRAALDQSPSRVETRQLYSPALNRSLPYLIYLPPGYDSEPEMRFPVLYMLHGRGGSYTEWQSYGIFTEADKLMPSGRSVPFIIVLLEGEDGYWVDHADGGPRWGTYVAVDAVNEIDTNFRTLTDRRFRGIGGNSMGAHGAMQLAMNYPRVFGSVQAHSPTLRSHQDAPPYFGDEAHFDAHDPVHQMAAHPDVARSLDLWIDIGEQDGWLPVVETFHQQLVQEAVPVEWHEYPGIHYGDYWTAHEDDYLTFQSSVFTTTVAASGDTAATR